MPSFSLATEAMAAIAQLIVYNAHNGEFVEIPKPVRFHTLPAFKEFLVETFASHAKCSTDDVFLLTPFGIKLNVNVINEMTECYYYDRRLFDRTASRDAALRYYHTNDIEHGAPSSFKFPLEHDESSIPHTFDQYEQWARALMQQTAKNHRLCDQLTRRINSIFKALNIIFQFVSTFVSSSEKSFNGYYSCIKLMWTKSLGSSWQVHYAALKALPRIQLKDNLPINLEEFLDETALLTAADLTRKHLPEIVEKFNAFSAAMTSINEETLGVDKMIEALRVESVATFKGFEESKKDLLKSIENYKSAFAEDVQMFRSVSKREQRVIYLQHKDLSNKFFEAADRVFNYSKSLLVFHRNLTSESIPIFQAIASLQMKAVQLRNDSRAIMVKTDTAIISEPNGANSAVDYYLLEKIRGAEDLLSMAIDIPLLFGFVLVEKRRQFEWHDFFLNGLVTGVSEQLTVVIEHERAFQSLWIKKFGHYIKHLDDSVELETHVPAIDVTAVNASTSTNPNSIFTWIGLTQPTREDILKYIEVLKDKKFEKFATILEKNYKDMVYSTDQMNKMTRIVSSLSAHVYMNDKERGSDTKLGLISELGKEGFDVNLVEGLKLRIRKLENLLHQNQYANLNNWPVVHSELTNSAAQMSLIVNKDAKQQTPLTLLQRDKPLKKSPSPNTPPRVLDASTTIDKHLDNIRLRKASTELGARNADLERDNEELVSRNEQLLSCNQDLVTCNKELVAHNQELSKGNDEYLKRVEELERQLKEKDVTFQALQKELALSHQKLKDVESEHASHMTSALHEKEKLEAELDSIKVEYSSSRAELQELSKVRAELAKANAELLTNILEKEEDFASERSDLQREINERSAEVEQKTEQVEGLLAAAKSKQTQADELLYKLNGALISLFGAISTLSSALIDYFREFCLVTQSMGLLLVREPTSDGKLEYRIKRVKGLRVRTSEEPENEHGPEMKTTVVKDIEEAFGWLQSAKEAINDKNKVDGNASINENSESIEIRSQQLIDVFSSFIDKGLLDNSVKLISFKEDVQLQSHENGVSADEGFFYNGIVKRFNDVEGYAKKLTKENKVKNSELTKALKVQNGKISINNFQEGDLVLFLPTIKDDDADERELTPWTAFNIDAPHYFLDVASQPTTSAKDWVVNRIVKIEAHEVTAGSDKKQNPYSLAVGDKWYTVTTK